MPSALQALGLTGTGELLLFMGAVLMLNATPGVDLLLAVSRTLKDGREAGVAAALGINAGCIVHALAAAFGLAALLAVSGQAFAWLKALGAAWLLWLAWGMAQAAWRGGPTPARGDASAPRGVLADFRAGLLTNLLNPKVALFFLAFLPQFIAAGTLHKTLAFLGLGALFVLQSTVFLLLLVVLVSRLRRPAVSPGMRRALNAAGAALFAGVAVRLLGARP